VEILQAGFNTVPTVLKNSFWYNLDAICAYAFLGTLISTVITALGASSRCRSKPRR